MSDRQQRYTEITENEQEVAVTAGQLKHPGDPMVGFHLFDSNSVAHLFLGYESAYNVSANCK